jgi:hypothetical protein
MEAIVRDLDSIDEIALSKDETWDAGDPRKPHVDHDGFDPEAAACK